MSAPSGHGLNVQQKGQRQKGIDHFFSLFWSLFGDHFVTFFAYPLLPPLRQGDGRPRKKIKIMRSERWGESFWVRTFARISARTSAGYPAQKVGKKLYV